MKARVEYLLAPGRCTGGYVLIEVMAAVVLVGALVVPLATGVQTAVSRAQAMRTQADGICDTIEVGGDADAWSWGATLESAIWEPGPELYLQIPSRARAGSVMGLWCDGWFLGEWEAESSGKALLPEAIWSGRAGCELVIRTRESEGCWGPPWRCVVPDTFCAIPTDGATRGLDAADDADSVWEGAVAHTPALGNSRLAASWADEPISESALGLTFFLPPATPGCCELSLDERTQSWSAETDRVVDVYF